MFDSFGYDLDDNPQQHDSEDGRNDEVKRSKVHRARKFQSDEFKEAQVGIARDIEHH